VEVIERKVGVHKVKEAWVQPREKIATLNRRWRRDFGLEKPNLTWLDTDGEPLLSELSAAAWARHGHKVAGHTGPFGLLRALAARAPVGQPNGRVQQSDGKPLLLALDDHDLSPLRSLVSGLAELWPVAAASRRGLQTS
jgi:hypothetical protein